MSVSLSGVISGRAIAYVAIGSQRDVDQFVGMAASLAQIYPNADRMSTPITLC